MMSKALHRVREMKCVMKKNKMSRIIPSVIRRERSDACLGNRVCDPHIGETSRKPGIFTKTVPTNGQNTT